MTDTVTDKAGRVLVVCELNILQQAKLLRAIGPAQSANEVYVNLVECAAMVDSIDGAPLPMPLNERQIDAMIQRLGDDGMLAVMAYRARKVRETMDALDAKAQEGVVTNPLASSAPSSTSSPSGSA